MQGRHFHRSKEAWLDIKTCLLDLSFQCLGNTIFLLPCSMLSDVHIGGGGDKGVEVEYIQTMHV